MAHKKQYFRIRCLASFAIMKQGGTPTHIVPFGHFGFTAKYKCTPYQNDTDNFFSRIPHDQIRGICHCLSNVPQLRDGQTDILVLPCAPCRSVLCLSCHVGISPIDCKHFACVAVLACTTLVGCVGIGPTQAHQCTRIPYGITYPLPLG